MDARSLIAMLAAASTVSVAACGSTTTVTKTVTVTKPAHTTVTAGGASAASTASSGNSPAYRVSSAYKHCDANIRAKRVTTTCGFAENAFYGYFISSGAETLRVYSPATGRTFTTRCSRGSTTITCRTFDGGVVKFPQSAIDAYSDEQAGSFAAAHEVGDTGVADSSAPSSSGDDAYGSDDPYDSSNPYTNPYDGPDSSVGDGADSSFCNTHDCIPNYENGNGSTVQCADGSYSHSGGIQGACSHHGGVR